MRLKTILRRIRLGLTSLPRHGDHPGTGWMILLVLLGFFAGGWLGGVAMLMVFGPLYLWGAYERGHEHETVTWENIRR